MRSWLKVATVAAVITASLAVTACGGERKVRITSRTDDEKGILKVVDALQCPETQGDLIRKGSAQAGGTICSYSGPRGSEVTLHLVRLDGTDVAEVLGTFESMLKRDLPEAAARMNAPQSPVSPTTPAAPGAQESPGGQAAGGTGVDMPGVNVRSDVDGETVRLPGLSVESSGDKSSVRIGGFHIQTNQGSEDVQISSSDESVSVQAHDDAAEIRTRAPGDTTRTTYLLTDTTASAAGWRLVGYEARGPAGGPLVVATVRSKDRDENSAFDDAKDLVSLNVGD